MELVMSEAEIDPVLIEKIENFVMPLVSSGMPVKWFPFGVRDGRDTEIAFVVKASGRNVNLRTAAGQFRSAVRHVDDPKLSLNAAQREAGAWDFTDEWYQEKKIKSDIEKRLAQLVERIGTLEVQLHRDEQDVQHKARSAASDRRGRGGHERYFSKLSRLRKEATDRGIAWANDWKVSQLQEALGDGANE